MLNIRAPRSPSIAIGKRTYRKGKKRNYPNYPGGIKSACVCHFWGLVDDSRIAAISLTLTITGGEHVRAVGACEFAVRVDGVVGHQKTVFVTFATPSIKSLT